MISLSELIDSIENCKDRVINKKCNECTYYEVNGSCFEKRKNDVLYYLNFLKEYHTRQKLRYEANILFALWQKIIRDENNNE